MRVLQLCEDSKPVRHGLSNAQKESLEAAIAAWQDDFSGAGKPPEPLCFQGKEGGSLVAHQFAGIIGTSEVTVEIYPKLDAALIHSEDDERVDPNSANTAMWNLLWMMQVAGGWECEETGNAPLQDTPLEWYDLFTMLLGRNLRAELQRGLPHRYLPQQDAIHAVRGRIQLGRQITSHWNRFDRVECLWDEFTADTPLNRLFKCACRFLAERVQHPTAWGLMQDCLGLLEEVEDVDPLTALRGAQQCHWDRTFDRFRKPFQLAERLLRGTSPVLASGDNDTFVFLVDMHQLFEDYVGAVLESGFGVTIEQQVKVGTLFSAPPTLNQIADFRWRDKSKQAWIGDAKYKHLAKAISTTVSHRHLVEADVRQLTVYGELERQRTGENASVNLLLAYPFVGEEPNFHAESAKAWNGSEFWIVPVDVRAKSATEHCLPSLPT